MGNTLVHLSEDDSSKDIMRSLSEDASCLTPPNPRIARFERKTITDVSWELPQWVPQWLYVDNNISQHVSERFLKDKVVVSPCPHNMKGTPVLIEIENKKTLTVNHEDALKSIQDKIRHVFGPLLQLWYIMKIEKKKV